MPKLQTRFRSAEDSPGFVLWKASNLLQRLHTGSLKDLGVTPTQFSLMTCLVYLAADGPVTPSQVVAHTGMDKMMVSDLLKTLVAKRLVSRRDNPDDRRSFLIAPTRRGERVTNDAIARVEEVDARFFSRIKRQKELHADLTALVEGGTQ